MSSSSSAKPIGAPVDGKWSTGFYDCFDDRHTCLTACFCPCIIMGQIAEIIDGGMTSQRKAGFVYCALGGCKACYAASYRKTLRDMFKLHEEQCNDFLVHECCCVCALTQEYLELKLRGADPSLGWQGNVEKWNREGIKVPPIPTRMARC